MRNTFFTLLFCTALTVISIPSSGFTQEKKEEAKDVKTLKVAEYTFKFSKPWVQQQAGGMRAGVLRFAQEDEKLENVDAVFFHMGGTVKQNLDRWKGQFVGEAKTSVEEKEVNGTKISYFHGKGNFMDSMGGPFAPKTEKDDYTVLGAILPSGGGRLVFLKLKGPSASVAAVKESFNKLVESALEK